MRLGATVGQNAGVGLRRDTEIPARRAHASRGDIELEVLTLLADGLHNSEIAGQLFVAEKTVDHHVSAILGKLGVSNRFQAVTQATRLGIAPQDD